MSQRSMLGISLKTITRIGKNWRRKRCELSPGLKVGFHICIWSGLGLTRLTDEMAVSLEKQGDIPIIQTVSGVTVASVSTAGRWEKAVKVKHSSHMHIEHRSHFWHIVQRDYS